MVTGFQEEDSAGHPKVLAYLKHFTMYNGPQATDTPKEMVSLHDLHESESLSSPRPPGTSLP